MATINYTAEVNLAARHVKVEWPGLSGNDDGQPFPSAGLRIASIHYWGNFNGGNVAVRASNEISPTNFAPIDDRTAPDVQFFSTPMPSVGAVSPLAGAGVSSVGVAVLFQLP